MMRSIWRKELFFITTTTLLLGGVFSSAWAQSSNTVVVPEGTRIIFDCGPTSSRSPETRLTILPGVTYVVQCGSTPPKALSESSSGAPLACECTNTGSVMGESHYAIDLALRQWKDQQWTEYTRVRIASEPKSLGECTQLINRIPECRLLRTLSPLVKNVPDMTAYRCTDAGSILGKKVYAVDLVTWQWQEGGWKERQKDRKISEAKPLEECLANIANMTSP